MKNSFRLFDLNLSCDIIRDKIVVIESDDWGSLRSHKGFIEGAICTKYPQLKISPYISNDCLETTEDLNKLFEVLNSFKDDHGNNPVITANTVMTNPDFNRIRDSDFVRYHYERFTDTLRNRDKNDAVIKLYSEGHTQKLFIPQFHGREHVNIEMWMNLLKNNEMFREAFDYQVWGISKDVRPDLRRSVQATLDTSFKLAEESVREGLDLFRRIFGFQSHTFIANNFIWDPNLHGLLKEKGVQFIQGAKYQLLPLYGKHKRNRLRHRFGERNDYNQIFGVRNCTLEVAVGQSTVDSCLKEIAMAFWMKKPAVISMHRLNFMGGIDAKNRDRGLSALSNLVKQLLKKWPDVQFMSTPQLNDYLRESRTE
ncbi:hypothetical protein OAL21_02925 [Akkermansiaceae bacterium]|nr:hypothetical protein [Akkermansiaceae bacterium]